MARKVLQDAQQSAEPEEMKDMRRACPKEGQNQAAWGQPDMEGQILPSQQARADSSSFHQRPTREKDDVT